MPADLNGDGKLDFVAAADGFVDVALANANGLFFEPVSTAVGATTLSPAQLVVVDLNADGHLDWLRTSLADNSVWYALGNGDGTFAAPVQVTGEFQNMGVYAEDFNADGMVDVALTSHGNDTLNIWRASSSLTWARNQVLASSGNASIVVGADVNSDNANDLLVGNDEAPYALTVHLRSGTSFGAGTSYALHGDAGSIKTVDVNGDGHPDVVVGHRTDPSFDVLLNHGDGTYAAAVRYPVASGAVPVANVADFDGDGHPDVLGGSGGNLQLFTGSANGTFTLAQTVLTDAAGYNDPGVAQAVADVNGDGLPDLLAMSMYDQHSLVLGNLGGANFTALVPPRVALPFSPFRVVAADIDADGVLDLVLANATTPGIALLHGSGDGNFALAGQWSLPVSYGVYNLVVGDLNYDGLLDVVTANSDNSSRSSDSVSVLLGTAGGNFATPVQYATGTASLPQGLALVDLNNDGIVDLAVSNTNGNNVRTYWGNGTGALNANKTISAMPTPTDLAALDVNGDGNVDLVVLSYAETKLTTLLNPGNGNLAASANSTTIGAGQSLAVGDFTGDGRADLLVLGDYARGLATGGGNGFFTTSVLSTFADVNLDQSSYYGGVGDIDGDGKLDFVVTSDVGLGNGAGGLRGGALAYTSPSYTSASAVGDFNGDGRVDFVAVSSSTNSVWIYLNGGCP